MVSIIADLDSDCFDARYLANHCCYYGEGVAMNKWTVPSVWVGTLGIATVFTFKIGNIASLVCSTLIVLLAGLVTVAVTNPERGK